MHEILKAEADLRVKYADAMGDAEYRDYCNTIREITRLEIELKQIHTIVGVLRDAYVPGLVTDLSRLMAQPINLRPGDTDRYDETLDKVLRRAKAKKMLKDLAEIKLHKLETKYQGKTGQVTDEYFDGLLISLSDSVGFRLDDSMSVWEFCDRIRRTNEKIKHFNNLNQSRRNG